MLLPILLFMARHVLTRRTPIGRKMMDEVRFHGGPCCASSAQTLPAAASNAAKPG